MYGAAFRVIQSRRILSEKSKKYFLLKSTQNLLKRIENHFKNVFEFFLKKNIHLGLRKISKTV